MKRILFAIIVTSLIVISFPGSALALNLGNLSGQSAVLPATTPSTHPCLSYQQRHYEVCTAYIFNSSFAARLPYYTYAKSPNPAWARLADYRLSSRYSGQAYQMLQDQVRSWPAGTATVSMPTITIRSVSVTSDLNFATLQTSESWEVRSPSNALLLREQNRAHTISMQRVPGLILHKWIVTRIR
jgi:hypothetical protein